MIDWTLAGSVMLSGLVIVFAALIILICLVLLMGKALEMTGKSKAAAPKPQAEEPPPAVQDGAGEETVAAITAAVACVMQESAPGAAYQITGIRRTKEPRPVWGFAGMQQNTRPF